MLKISSSEKTAIVFPDSQSVSVDLYRKFTEQYADGMQGISYRNLLSIIGDLQALISDETRKDDLLVLPVSNRIDSILLILTLWARGTTPLLVSEKIIQKEISELSDFFRIKVIGQGHLLGSIARDVDLTAPDDLTIDTGKDCSVILTSGSEGKPSAAVVPFTSVAEHLYITGKIFGDQSISRWLLSLPVNHVSVLAILCRALFNQGTLFIPESQKAEDLIPLINRHGITHCSLVNAQLQDLAEMQLAGDNKLKCVLVGGGPSDSGVIRESLKKGWPIYKVYGATETFTMITAVDLTRNPEKIDTSGKFLDGVTGKIIPVDESLTEEEGEVLVKSPTLIRQFLGDEGKGKEKFRNGYFHTGDIGKIDSEGYLTLLMRRTDLIVSGGLNINPLEIERALISTGLIEEVCVTGKQDTRWGEIVVALVKVKQGNDVTAEMLNQKLGDKIDDRKNPKEYVFVESLPRTELGKLKRAEIRKNINKSIIP